jgi:hypothetical protein
MEQAWTERFGVNKPGTWLTTGLRQWQWTCPDTAGQKENFSQQSLKWLIGWPT